MPNVKLLGVFIMSLGVGFAPQVRADETCPGDVNDDHMVTINELITDVSAALIGCPAPLTNLPIAGSWLLVFRNSGGGDAEALQITSAGSVAIRSGLLTTPMESTGQIAVLNSDERIYSLKT